jgi:predicted alpha/beta hydrolase family esterase
VLAPDMPNKTNAKYAEWKIWFQKFISHIKPGVVLIGHSLGGLFLAKFLAVTKFPKKIRATFLVAPPYGEGDFSLPKKLQRFAAQAGKIFLYQSKDDRVVPFVNFFKYQKALPGAAGRIFTNRGHFRQPRFPELVRDIKKAFG